MEVSSFLRSQVFGLYIFQWVKSDQQVAVCRLSLKQFFFHFSAFFEIGSVLLKNALFDSFDLGLDVTKFLGVQSSMLSLFLTLDLLLLSCQDLSLFGHLLQANLASLETLLKLTLF